MMSNITTTAGIEPTEELARRVATKLRGPRRQDIGDFIDLGLDLIQIKAALGHRRFGSWLRSECPGSERVAKIFMHVASALGGEAT